MLRAALASGAAHRRAVFEVFARHLPGDRRYGVVAGTGRLLDALEHFRFGEEELDLPASAAGRRRPDRRVPRRLPVHRGRARLPRGRVLLPRLADPRGGGHVRRGRAAGDADPVDPQPRLRDRRRGLPHGARRRLAAADRDGLAPYPRGRRGRRGPRRLHLRLRRHLQPARPGCGTACRPPGTSAHAFTLLHDSEADAFRAQLDSLGTATTLLVDTYDVATAVRTAVELAGPDLGAVRIDSGDLAEAAREVRALLDALGAHRHPDRGHRRPRRVRDRRARRRPGRRLRRRHLAGHRLRRAHGRAGLQARRPGGRPGRDAAGRQALGGQAQPRRAQVRVPGDRARTGARARS